MKDVMLTVCPPVGPEVDLDASVKERMVVHAGGVIRIIAYVSGQPTPDVTWSRDGSALPPEAKVETTLISSALIIKPCSRKHLGVYTLMAKNAGGEKKKNVTVEVLGKFWCARITSILYIQDVHQLKPEHVSPQMSQDLLAFLSLQRT